MHPTDERLEAFCDGTLERSGKTVIEAHLVQCGRCRGEVEEWRSLFSVLAGLPVFAPAVGFADRVMAHVRIPEPWYARASQVFGRFLPRTTMGWAMAVALLAVPVLAVGTLAFWLLSRSYLTGYRLWVFATDQFAAGANQVAAGAFSRVVSTDVSVWLVRSITSFMESSGMRGLGAVAAVLACVIMVSIWVLYRNLFRNPNRGSSYVTFTI
jgi:predicted anti-sigma-YlaC factor YlaD